MTYTAHMVQHVLLSQIVPLIVVQRVPAGGRVRVPAGAGWVVGLIVTIALALPAAHTAVAQDAALAWSGRVALVLAGCLFWMPVGAGGRVRGPAAVVYLVTACFATTIAGATIAFGGGTTDQQVAGLIMWVPCCLIYLAAVLVVVSRALHRPRPTQAIVE